MTPLASLGLNEAATRDLRVLLDTSSLMDDSIEEFLGTFLVPLVRASDQRLVVPHRVMQECKKHATSTDPERSRKGHRAAALVEKMVAEQLADVFGEPDEFFADNVIQAVVMRFCEKYHFCLVTQDRALATDTLRIASRPSVKLNRAIFALRVGEGAALDRWEIDPNSLDLATWTRLVRSSRSANNGALRLCSGTPRPAGLQLAISEVPSQGAQIRDSSGERLTLIGRLGGGGEGTVYRTDARMVCKIYAPERLSSGTREKLELMIRKPITWAGICWPRSLAFNSKNEFVGYLMPAAEGKELQKSVFIKPLLQKAFPSWTRVDLVTLALTLLESIQHLHSRNVIVGDINPMNILVKSPTEVFIVDTDSFQIEDFPCPVGTATFLSPDLYGKRLSGILRNFQHEHFAVATLAFMIVMPGKPPYSHAGGGDPAENVRTRKFPYGLGERRGQGVPDGPWRFMWSHLPYKLKQKFVGAFDGSDELSTVEWIDSMYAYRDALRAGHVSSEIYPTGFKRLRREDVLRIGGKWGRCPECGSEAQLDDRDQDTIACLECFAAEEEARCSICGNTFAIRTLLRKKLGERSPICGPCRTREEATCACCSSAFELPRFKLKTLGERRPMCPSCLAPETTGCPHCGSSFQMPHFKLQAMGARRPMCSACWNRSESATCCDCGSRFEFQPAFFKDKGWEPPRRCSECRERRKAARGGASPEPSYRAPVRAPIQRPPPPPTQARVPPRTTPTPAQAPQPAGFWDFLKRMFGS